MNEKDMSNACELVADSICKAISKYLAQADSKSIAAAGISLNDDFSWAGFVATSPAGLEEGWDSVFTGDAYDIDSEHFENVLGEVELEEPDDLENAALWLAALTNSLRIAANKTDFGADTTPFLFCRLIDSAESWYTARSAKQLTEPSVFNAHFKELFEDEGFEEGEDPFKEGDMDLQQAYEKQVAKLFD